MFDKMDISSVLPEIVNRRSIRKYKPDDISDEDIYAIINAARLSPSGNNSQPWRFLVIRDEETKHKIVEAERNQDWMLSAPVFIVCMADLKARDDTDLDSFITEDESSFEVKRVIRDTAVAIENLLLQCTHMGLGSCWTGNYTQKNMRRAIDVPNEFFILGVVTVGVPDENPEMRPRKSIDEILKFNRW